MTQVIARNHVDCFAPREYSLVLNISRSFEIVVAHFNEDLTWLSGNGNEVTVYSKGNLPPAIFQRIHQLPNIGREGHTILHHIVRRYDTLADTTLFLQGDIHDWNSGTPPHTSLSLAELRRKSMALTGASYEGFGVNGTFDYWDGMPWDDDPKKWFERRGQGMKRTQITPGDFWQIVFGTEHPDIIEWTSSAIFAVRADAIRQRPLSFWTNLLGYFEKLNHPNPEEGHFLERFWMSIFSPDDPAIFLAPKAPHSDSGCDLD